MNAKRIARWGIVIAALCAGFGVAGQNAPRTESAVANAPATHPLSAETLPIPAPDIADGRRAGPL